MKKIIIILTLLAINLNAADLPYVKLNIKYNGKVYKNFECQVISYENNKAVIYTRKGKRIMVEVGKSSKKTILQALIINEKLVRAEIETKKNAASILKISRMIMFQNLSPNGCLVKISYMIRGPWTDPRGRQYSDIYHTVSKIVYLTDSFDIADDQVIWSAKGSSNATKILYRKGLHKYTQTSGARRTIEKFSFNK